MRYAYYRRVWPVAGWSVGAVKARLRDCWNVGYVVDPWVNGQSGRLSDRLRPGDTLHFRRRLGRKGADSDGRTEADYVWADYPELGQIVAEVLATEPSRERAVVLAVRRVVRFMDDRFGPPRKEEVVLLQQVLERLAALVETLASTRIRESQTASDRNPGILQPSAGSELPAEMTTAQAAEVLGVSKDTVLRYKDAGLLEYRDIAPPGRSRPIFLFASRSVISLRTSYRTDGGSSRLPEPPRRARAGGRRYRHLDIDD